MTVTVIIPTLANRPEELERALQSIISQRDIDATPLVVVNGRRYDPDLVNRLRQRPGIRFHQIETASVSRARFEGRRQVETTYFAFLDDDDELLPEALSLRYNAFADHKSDVVVTNGYRQKGQKREVIFPKFGHDLNDPARGLLEENWLASAGGLFRTETVNDHHFEGLPDFLEMTFLAFKMAHHLTITRLDIPTFVIHAGAADQASASWRYYQEVPKILRQMQELTPRGDLRVRLRQKQAAALHEASVKALQNKDKLSAWKYHLRSLTTGNGLRYFPYTRHIVRPHSQL